jgi:glutaconate CoA-transferase subunit B
MKEYAKEYTREEQIVTQLARVFRPDDMLGIASMSNSGFVAIALAQRLYAPRAAVYMDAQGSTGTGTLLSGVRFPFFAGFPPDDFVVASLDSRDIFALLIAGKWNIFMQPAQIDKFGNMNISAIGDWSKPASALVGARGVPDNTTNGGRVYYFVPEHTKRIFVEKVDFICGVGYGPAREKGLVKEGAVDKVFSNLGASA